MTEIRCPNCGKNNSDILDVCQFCQTPLKPEAMLRIGDSPTKKNTGELESVLPDWLRDVRQQARDSAEEEAAQAAAQPKPQKNEPPDLLAGLASQAGRADDEEVPDWLASINPTVKPKPFDPSQDKPPAPTPPAQGTDFFAQFNQGESKPFSEPAEDDVPSPARDLADQTQSSENKDELSAWFAKASEQPDEIVEINSDIPETAWGSNLDAAFPVRQEPAPTEEEDLSWLRNLEEAAKQTGDLKTPKKEADWTANFETPSTPSQSSASQEDLRWLDSLGGIEEALQQSPEQPPNVQNDLSWLDQFGGGQSPQSLDAASEKPSSQEDLSWLNNLASVPEPSQPSNTFVPEESVDAVPDKPVPSQPPVSKDLDWLNSLGAASEPAQAVQPFEVPEEQPSSSEDLSWLNNLDKTSAPSQSLSQEDLSWLKDLGGDPEPLATPPFAESESPPEENRPRQTAPLGKKDATEETEPDWLKSATEAPSMPAPGNLSMDWFTQHDQPFGAQAKPAEEKPVPPSGTLQPPPFSDFLSTPSEPAPLSNQDVDSLFSVDMPDWLSQPEPTTDELAAPQVDLTSTEGEESLAPVDLPSWVQAMRPVEAVISETAPGMEDQPEEKEGPLAGLRGVIPGAPVGSSRRPKAISLKLQVTDEQQTSAALLEQILGNETSPRALRTFSFIGSQQVLRWALTGLFLVVLSAVILLRSQTMLISATLPVDASGLSNVMLSIPADAKVLMVIDYEPSLAGEMEAIGGPVLNQMVALSHPHLSFISTSPNGAALVERLITHARLKDSFGYQAGQQYLNLGYLPGGAAGVLGFMERPAEIVPTSGIESFANYAALIVMTDHAESGRVWVEQLQNRKQLDPLLAGQPLLVMASAQAGPLLQPYVSSGQIAGMISGLSDAARYEAANNIPPGRARSYWDAFGIGLMMAIALIVIGSLWSVLTGMRAHRAEAEQS
jgi:hypothetical protein